MNPLIAVRLLTYNQENYISQCIESVLMQITDFEYKIIIGEDCSTDKTKTICKEYAKNYPDRIILLCNEKNSIKKNSRDNFEACHKAGVKYVALLEGDDYWTDPLKLQKQVAFLEANPNYSFTFHDVAIENVSGRIVFPLPIPSSSSLEFIDVLNKHYIYTLSLVFRTDFVSWPDWLYDVKSADIAIELLLASRGKGYYLPETMGTYRVHGAGITNSSTHKNPLKYFHERVKLYRYVDKHLNFRYRNLINNRIESFVKETFPMKGNIRSNLKFRITKFLLRLYYNF
jgi:glycosyltransferase involved in cell wall biosynthesis